MAAPISTALKQELPVGLGFGLHHGLGILQLRVHFHLGEVYLAEDAHGTFVTPFQDEPAGTLGDEEDDAEEEDGRKAAETEHAAPHFGHEHQVHPSGIEHRAALREVEQLEIGEVGSQESDGDGQLVERNQASAVLRDGDFGNVERRDDGDHADADAAQDACHHQLLERADKRAGDAGHGEEDGCHEHRHLTSPAVAQLARHQYADDRTYQCTADKPAHLYFIK